MDLLSWTLGTTVPSPEAPILIDAIDPSQWLSFSMIRSEVRKLIAGLKAVGITSGDVVWVNCFNDLRYCVMYLGIIGAGAIFAGINPASTPTELSHHFQITDPKLIIAEPVLLNKTLLMAEQTGFDKSKILVFDTSPLSATTGMQSWHTLLEYGEGNWIRPEDPEKTIATYSATSGTSGLPKWAMIPHSYLISQAALQCSGEPAETTRLFMLAPFHAFGSPIVPASIRQGIRTYIMRRYIESQFIDSIYRFGVTETYIAPPILLSLPASPQTRAGHLRSLRSIWVGGASVKYAQQKPLYKYLDDSARIRAVWGLTEAGWLTSVRDERRRLDDSVGQRLDGFDLTLVDRTGAVIDKDDVKGELLIRAKYPFVEYLNNPSATADAFTPGGFLLRSGDIGCRRTDLETGFASFYIVDRVKELIKVRGWQVSPTEVESELLQHPAIEDAAVIGATESNGGEEYVRAYVVLKQRACEPTTAPEIRAWLRERLSGYKLPQEIRFVGSIPRNNTGKILRRVLRNGAQMPGVTAAESGPGLDDVNGSHKQGPVSPTTVARHAGVKAKSS
ncbi:4-coumarate-CoA ligase [Phyllosticta citribraziliensis]|uniref:4-coumarate-CoA ligase n=1 Tax=Phyllosticta citribraziliensis TaxID=989973 RepID=A0ABR1L8B0_9PEZI